MAADEFFEPLPKGYEYSPPDAEVEEQMMSNFERSGGAVFISDLSLRNVEYGGAPVASVLIIVFDEAASSADRAGLVRGMEREAGVKARAVKLSGRPALYLDADPKTFVYMSKTHVIAIFGKDRSRLTTIAAALVSGP